MTVTAAGFARVGVVLILAGCVAACGDAGTVTAGGTSGASGEFAFDTRTQPRPVVPGALPEAEYAWPVPTVIGSIKSHSQTEVVGVYPAFGIDHVVTIKLSGDVNDLRRADFVVGGPSPEENVDGTPNKPVMVGDTLVSGPKGDGKLSVTFDPPIRQDLASSIVTGIVILPGPVAREAFKRFELPPAEKSELTDLDETTFDIDGIAVQRTVRITRDGQFMVSGDPIEGQRGAPNVSDSGSYTGGLPPICDRFATFTVDGETHMLNKCPYGVDFLSSEHVAIVDDPLIRGTWVLFSGAEKAKVQVEQIDPDGHSERWVTELSSDWMVG